MKSLVFLVLMAGSPFLGAAAAQEKPPQPDGCEPGFRLIPHPQGKELSFTCRTRVIDCAERPGHHVAIIPDRTLELQAGVQFSYRCLYTPIGR